MKYAVNGNGIQALESLSVIITDSVSQLFRLTMMMEGYADDNNEVLGPHKASLISELKIIYEAIKESAEPVKCISDKLKEIAEIYQELVENDRLKAAYDNRLSQNGSGGTQSRIDSFTGDNNSSINPQKFGSFDTGKYKNGDSVIKGDNFEQYISNYYDSENFVYESLGEHSVIESIPPSQIEGIHIGSTEMEDNGLFWGQHEKGGTANSFKEIASQIPIVKSQLDAGKTLSDIRKDSNLGKCVDIYFEPSNIPRVVKNKGYYEFDSNGRHRILAARELGYNIPVRIIGIRKKK